MLLGISRTADLAGWSGGTNQTSDLTISVPVTTAYPNSYVGGLYYQDFSGITVNTVATTNAENQAVGAGSSLFDQTSISNSPKLSVKAITFKINTGWGNYSTWNQLGRVYTHYSAFNSSGGAVNNGQFALNIQTSQTTGTVNFNGTLWNAQYASSSMPFTVSSLQASYANRWLGFVSATSTTTSTFANWTGGSLTASNWCERIILIDIASQTIISQADLVATATGGTIPNMDFTTQNWELGTGSYRFFSIGNLQENPASATFEATPFYKLSDWFTVGNTFDPVTYWPQITGETPQGTVNSVQGWYSTNSTSAGTSTTYIGSPAYFISVTAATRQPAGANQYIINPYSTSPAPVYTSFTGY